MSGKHTITAGLSIMLAAFLMSGYSRMSEEEAQIRNDYSSIPEEMPVRNLGNVEMISGEPIEFDLAKGRHLSITATETDDGTLEMIFNYRAASRKIGGIVKEVYTEKSRFLLRPGMRCAPKMGDDIAVVIRPKIVEPNLFPVNRL